MVGQVIVVHNSHIAYSLMEMFESNDSLQLAYSCVPAGLHTPCNANSYCTLIDHDRTITIILCLMKSFLKAVQ